MSTREVLARLQYRAYCAVERRRQRRGALAHTGDLRAALRPSLARHADWQRALLDARRETGRFYAGVRAGSATRDLFLNRFQKERHQALVHADAALRLEFSFFGGTYKYHGRVDWKADPVTRAHWPDVYHADVPVHGGDIGFGDVKHVWELNRHQFLIDLAKAWFIARDPRYSAAARDLVFDWMSSNPVGRGVAWACALEPAFRSLSWLWAYHLTADDPDFDDNAHLRWLSGFLEHGWFLYRHLEYHTSPFNHLIGEACALYCLGVLFPEFGEAPRWRARGRNVLESHLSAQFYSDGGTVEQSTFYHHATTGFYLLAAILGRANQDEFSEPVHQAIQRALAFAALLQQPDGTTPRIGGADDGKPIRLEHLPLWDFRPYQTIGAVLYGRPDFKRAAGRFYEDALWLLGPTAIHKFEQLIDSPTADASGALPASGYVVIRDAARGSYLCFDCGEQAAGLRRDAIASAAHGHADCLSVVLWQRGRPVLIDAGFFCYNGPKAWQDFFRETAAHNTVRIDGRDQATHVNKMAWSETYAATLEGCDLESRSKWAIASHDGYRRLPGGAVHHRRVVWVRERGYVVVCDFLEGDGEHLAELVFQFAPGVLSVCESGARFDDRVNVSWRARGPLTPRVSEGVETPDGGWIAPSLGIRQPAPRLVLTGRFTVPTSIVTIIADGEPGACRVDTRDRRSSFTVSGDGWTDWIVVRGLTGERTGDLETDAWAAAWTTRGHDIVADGRVAGTYQRSGSTAEGRS